MGYKIEIRRQQLKFTTTFKKSSEKKPTWKYLNTDNQRNCW